jgi:glycine/D-amino acid oxidase-like deaminating enzyme
MARSIRDLSLWWDELGEPTPRASLSSDLDVDIAIVGGGFTGLWTARSLKEIDRDLRIAIIEKEVCGFGASGRNGGWASALFAASDAKIARESGAAQAHAMRQAMNESIGAIERATREDGIECHFARGGTIVMARNDAQVSRSHDEILEARSLGFDEETIRWLDAKDTAKILRARNVMGGTFTPHCASLQPAKLVRGLSDSLERKGVVIYEQTTARSLHPGTAHSRPCVVTENGTVRADVVVRATEGWTSQFQESRKAVIPVYSLMIATEPLAQEQWSEIGLLNRETFADHRHMVIYGQRTHDGRIAFGGRGAPYHFGSTIKSSYNQNQKVFATLRATLLDLFPHLSNVAITHQWGGPLGIPRDWYSSVTFDKTTGMAAAGGYVGDGVTTSNLAGRTLADLILGNDSALTRLPWVNHQSPAWEPEPFRWIGINAGIKAASFSDASEQRRGKPSWVGNKLANLLGG